MNGNNPYAPTRSPYAPIAERPRAHRGRMAQAGMTLVEMLVWLAIMAVLSLGMLWLLWTTAR